MLSFPATRLMQSVFDDMLSADAGLLVPSVPNVANGRRDLVVQGKAESDRTLGLPMNMSMDVKETPTTVMVRADLPGVSENDLKVEITDNILKVSAERNEEKVEDRDHFYRRERRFGSVSRTVKLPRCCDDSNVQASFTNGVLEVTVPKKEETEEPCNGNSYCYCVLSPTTCSSAVFTSSSSSSSVVELLVACSEN